MLIFLRNFFCFFVLFLFFDNAYANQPVLISSASDIAAMKTAKDNQPAFKDAYLALKKDLDERMREPVDVPIPKDPGGGYTHEQHKKNYKLIYDAGAIYQLSGDKKYAIFAKNLLLKYAKLYPTLGRHPVVKSSSPGRLFWQSLNEAVFLVYTIQGYVAIVDTLNSDDKNNIENNFLRKMASFISEGQPKVFNKIHNHGTWATAAVGMTGYALGDKDLVEKSLYGLDKSGKGGFLKQLDKLFSPDGYFNEGPYYQRYALMPFILFAKTIQVNEPERKIFEYRDGVLKKAVYTAVELSYAGKLLPINDVIKDKGIDTVELIYAVAIAYGLTGDRQLLSIAKYQDRILLFGDGLRIAEGISAGKTEDLVLPSKIYADGNQGTEGALGVFRSNNGRQALIAKYTSQGLGHGHFDKLGWSFYDNGLEIIPDYGAARFLNVATKSGGGYLKENKTWANQTVAHNTLVVDETSHFKGKTKEGNKHAPVILASHIADDVQLMSGQMDAAYKGVSFVRTSALISHESLPYPIVVDLLNVTSDKIHQYDLPLYYTGHIVDISFAVNAYTDQMSKLGEKNGYQHLWRKADAKPEGDIAQISWLTDNRFYTYTTRIDNHPQAIFVELGATDPNFNLRRESGFIFRVQGQKRHSFVSVLEPHGEYNGRDEFVSNAKSQIGDLQLVHSDSNDVVVISLLSGKKLALALSYNNDMHEEHSAMLAGKRYTWSGAAKLFDL